MTIMVRGNVSNPSITTRFEVEVVAADVREIVRKKLEQEFSDEATIEIDECWLTGIRLWQDMVGPA